MSAADRKIPGTAYWRAYTKGVPYTVSEAEKPVADATLEEVESRILKAFETDALKILDGAWPRRSAMPVHQASADMTPFFPVYPPLIVPQDALIHRPVSLAAGTVNYAYNAADRKAKTAKNKRRYRARWRRREARRLEQELLCMRGDGDPEREASEVAAHALPALAPEATARGEEGKPGPGAGIYDDLPFIECDDKRYVFKVRTPLPPERVIPAPEAEIEEAFLQGMGQRISQTFIYSADSSAPPSEVPLPSKPEAHPLAFWGKRFRRPDEIARMNADQRRAVDDEAGLVPLPSKPAEPEPSPYVPMKWGEHD